MKLPVEESEFIFCDVQDIVRYLRRRNPAAAVRFVESFKSAVDLLWEMPHLGRSRADLGAPDTRSWRVSGFRNYVLMPRLPRDVDPRPREISLVALMALPVFRSPYAGGFFEAACPESSPLPWPSRCLKRWAPS